MKHTPSQTLDPSLLHQPLDHADMERFVSALQKFFLNYNPHEGEEHNKNLIRDLLRQTFYDGQNAINTYGNADSAIYATEVSRTSQPVVLCETKRANSPEMPTERHLNRKGLHELILYYIHEEVVCQNRSIRHLIITDGLHWFIFKKKTLYTLFVKDKTLVGQILEMDANDDYHRNDIYREVIKPAVEKVTDELDYTYFDLEPFCEKTDTLINNARLKAIYKLLSPAHLLAQQSYTDYNTLNHSFYNELLYILGLEDVVDSTGNLHKIKRMPKNRRQYYSLLEQTLLKLEDYGLTNQDEMFETALSLVLEWTNRLLFIKLLEGQLNSIVGDRRKKLLMTIEHIPDYSTFYDLCMTILAKPYDERNKEMSERFNEVPFLNSSLFELSELERQYFSINAISRGNLMVYNQTAVRMDGHRVHGKMDSLEYLLRFLGSYDFGSIHDADQDSETIINASVLGRIFEKINGYRDGSYFTPGCVAEYMCRDVLRQTVVERFNLVMGWKCTTLDEVKERIDCHLPNVRQQANDIINSLRICDPAVGSGHFLVAILNEIIHIKSQLGILQAPDIWKNKRLQEYEVKNENGELILKRWDGQAFAYDPDDNTSQRIQVTLFEEKRTIIENCLFGVDINPKSVEICRLRLWIELLKHIYYIGDGQGHRYLKTLPNIDINIKCGNSLLSKVPIVSGHPSPDMDFAPEAAARYKAAVLEYKGCSNKHRKAELRKIIANYKLGNLTEGSQTTFYHPLTKVEALEKSQYHDSMEWMIEFPEILSDDMCFIGFDIVIGNPPYLSLESQREFSRYIKRHHSYKTYDSRADLSSLFVERAFSLLKTGGRLCYILPNKWTKVGAGTALRGLLAQKNMVRFVDFSDNKIFDEATTYTCIIHVINREVSSNSTFSCATLRDLTKTDKKMLWQQIDYCSELVSAAEFDSSIWFTSSSKHRQQIKLLNAKCKSLQDYLGCEAKRGLLTGNTNVFTMTEATRNQLCATNANAANVIVPLLQGRNMQAFLPAMHENYLLFLPKGFTRQGMGYSNDISKPDEDTAWQWLTNNYPSISDYLFPFADECRHRSDQGDYWWELRACSYYDLFAQPKILYQVIAVKPCFTYNDGDLKCNNSIWFMPTSDLRLLALLNTDVAWWLMREYCPPVRGGCQLIWDNLRQIPIPGDLPQEWTDMVDQLVKANIANDTATYDRLMEELNISVRHTYGIPNDFEL